jgi:hypothetical protein
MPNRRVPKVQVLKQAAFIAPVEPENEKTVSRTRAAAVVLVVAVVAICWLV